MPAHRRVLEIVTKGISKTLDVKEPMADDTQKSKRKRKAKAESADVIEAAPAAETVVPKNTSGESAKSKRKRKAKPDAAETDTALPAVESPAATEAEAVLNEAKPVD